jgi:hypothetical protein
MEGQPRNPAAAPPVQSSPASSGGSGFIWPVLFVGAAVLLLLWFWRRRLARPPTAAAAPGLAGSTQTRFRVGMTMPVDPSPFLLAAGLTKVQPLEGSGMTSVEVVGLLRDRAALLHRLYLPGGKAFFQLHLGADGHRTNAAISLPGRGHPGGQPRVGSVARSGRGHDRMAVVSDQGRQDVRTRLGAG